MDKERRKEKKREKTKKYYSKGLIIVTYCYDLYNVELSPRSHSDLAILSP